METKNEIWKDIEGYEGYYQVSNIGRVRSLDRVIERKGKPARLKGKILSQVVNCGYLYVCFRKNGDGKNYHHAVHRLVGKAFVSGYKEGYDINHKDNVRSNNNAENLEWCTRSYNIQYMRDYFPRIDTQKRAVIQMDLDGNEIAKYEKMNDAAKATGINVGNIGNVCQGRSKTAGGYLWRYADK